MDFKLATLNDLPQLFDMYKEVVKYMDKIYINIWDEVYPFEFLKADIERKELYLLFDKDIIVSAFALCQKNEDDNIGWNDKQAKAIYINRLGVNVNYLQLGIGSLMLNKAEEIAKQKEIKYLRLFVVDFNLPAINLYLKNN